MPHATWKSGRLPAAALIGLLAAASPSAGQQPTGRRPLPPTGQPVSPELMASLRARGGAMAGNPGAPPNGPGIRRVADEKPAVLPAPREAQSPQPAPALAPTVVPGPTVTVGSDRPAYRWYGYGAARPLSNPSAPGGRYPEVPGAWYDHTGATPGAVPEQSHAHTPVVVAGSILPPIPVPPIDPVIQTGGRADARGARPSAAASPMPMQVRPDAGHRPSPSLPPPPPTEPRPKVRLQSPRSVARAQSPAADPLDAIRSEVARACGEDAEVTAAGPGALKVRFTVLHPAHAEVVANRVAAIPALRPYRVDFEVRVNTGPGGRN